jgi:hypothetical protein
MSQILGDLDRDVQNKIASKYNPQQEKDVRSWIEGILGERLSGSNLFDGLHSGVKLIALLNHLIQSGTKLRANDKDMPFAHRENISKYLDTCKSKGMNLVDLFDTQDLYDQKNVVTVLNHFYALSDCSVNWGFKGPYLRITELGAPPQVKKSPNPSPKPSIREDVAKLSISPQKSANPSPKPSVREDKAVYGKSQEDETLGELDRDLKNRIAAKYDPGREKEVIEWIEAVTRANLAGSLADGLHDGKVLCKLLNIIFPNTVTDVSEKSMPFFQRENISKYLDGCKRRGMILVDLFDTQDLYDNKNIVNVINHFYSFSSFARSSSKSFKGPYIGVKLSSANHREFTEQQLKAGNAIPSMQNQGSYGVVDPSVQDVKFTHVIKDVDQIKRTQEASQQKAKNLFG